MHGAIIRFLNNPVTLFILFDLLTEKAYPLQGENTLNASKSNASIKTAMVYPFADANTI